MNTSNEGLIGFILGLPIFQAEWVLWLLILLSLVSVAIMVERFWFYRSRRVDQEAVRKGLEAKLADGDLIDAAKYLEQYDSYETNVALFGLRRADRGPDAVENLIAGAEATERQRYEQRLGFLATMGSNAPFIGLFGTVLGVIKAFVDLQGQVSQAGSELWAGIAEALVATGVGLLVAIPAVITFNLYMTMVNNAAARSELLSRTVMAHLLSVPQDAETA